MNPNESGEGYSREAYEEAQRKVDEANQALEPSRIAKPDQAEREKIKGQRDLAERGRDELYGKAWDEALALNEEYKQVLKQKDQAETKIQELRQKMGLDRGKPEEEQGEREPTLEEQTKIYAEMLDIPQEEILEAAKALQAKMTEQEREELTMLIFSPKGETASTAWERVRKENPTWQSQDPRTISTQAETAKALVAFARFSQEPDPDSLGEDAQSTEDWEKTGGRFMSPRLRMLAGEMYRRAKGRQLDEVNATLCPGSRFEHGDVPSLCFSRAYGEVDLVGADPSVRSPHLGVRRVVSMELES